MQKSTANLCSLVFISKIVIFGQFLTKNWNFFNFDPSPIPSVQLCATFDFAPS
jgi:hypothetical protein